AWIAPEAGGGFAPKQRPKGAMEDQVDEPVSVEIPREEARRGGLRAELLLRSERPERGAARGLGGETGRAGAEHRHLVAREREQIGASVAVVVALPELPPSDQRGEGARSVPARGVG